MRHLLSRLICVVTLASASTRLSAEDWLQYKFDAGHSGNATDREIQTPLGLVAAVPLSDGVYASPVIADGKVYVVDGSGVAFCFDANTLKPVWRTPTRGGADNCNNVSSPAIAGKFLHFGTMSGWYCVLDRESGKIVREIDCRDPIFSAPALSQGRVYFETLGSQVYAVEPDGEVA